MQARKSIGQNSRGLLVLSVTLTLWLMAFWGGVAVADYSATAHGDAADGVNRTDAGYSIGSCAHCHDTFDSDICTGVTGGPSMLFAELDNPDFCMACHTDTGSAQNGGMSGAPASLASIFDGVYNGDPGHNVLDYADLHRFWPVSPPAYPDEGVENRTYLSANKHVECNDCHNPHTAEVGLHNELATNAGLDLAGGTNNISDSGPLTGAFGVSPTLWKQWDVYAMSWSTRGAQSWPSTSSTATKEYNICFKCHSGYNTNATSWGGSGAAAWTQVDLEFNPRNQSYHPVVQALPEVDPGYYYYHDTYWGDEEHDTFGSNRLPPSHTSVLIGDSGKATGTSAGIQDSTKSWQTDEWVGWGLRVGALSYITNSNYNPIRRITSNTSTSLGFTPGTTLTATNTVYSIEYYAGYADASGSGKSGNTVTDTTKNFNLYLPSLAGYTVMITDAGVTKVAKGVIQSNTATSFTVNSWQLMYGTAVPGDTAVCYFVSGTGQAMMCSDCHSTDTISSTTAQGPHGSSVKWMLKGRNKAWPTLSAADNGTGTGTTLRRIGDTSGVVEHRAMYDGTDDGLFCLNCHSVVSFTKDLYGRENSANVHAPHAQADNPPTIMKGPACVECHVLVPHGSAMSRLIGNVCAYSNAAMPARYNFDNQNKMQAFGAKTFPADHSGTTGDPALYTGDQGSGPGYCSSRLSNCHPNLDEGDCGWFSWTWD
jgi:hypothetical protein